MCATNEYKIVRQGFSTSLYDMPLLVTYNMTYMCNYHCSYCGQHCLRPKSPDWLPAEKIRAIFLNLRKLNRPEYLITLSGGEPTIHPYFIDTVANLESIFGERLSCLTVISNGSRNPNVYRELLRFGKGLPLELMISLHTDHMELDHIIELIESFANDAYLNIQLMFNPDKRDYVHQIYSSMCELRKHKQFDLCVVQLRDFARGNAVDSRYTDEDFAFLDSAWRNFQKFASGAQPVRERNRNYNQFLMARSLAGEVEYTCAPITDFPAAQRRGDFAHKGRYCAMGTHQMLIHPNGTASNAICMQAHCTAFPLYEKSPYADPEFANIFQCKLDYCGCYTNNYLQKFQVKDEADNYLAHFRIKARRYEEEFSRDAEMRAAMLRQGELLTRLMLANSHIRNLVDGDFYYKTYPDVEAAGIPAAEHYFLYGWKEGRNPRADFDTRKLIESHGELKALGICPLILELQKGLSPGEPHTSGKTASSYGKLSAEIKGRMQTLPLVREATDAIDPENTAVVCAISHLVEAATHYRIILGGKAPRFLLEDWIPAQDSATAEIAKQLQCEVAPFQGHDEASFDNLCVYCRPSPSGYGSKDSFINFEMRLHERGMPGRHLVAARTLAGMEWQRKPDPDCLAANEDSICRIYEKFADDGSRDVFIAVLKSIETGDPGYLPMSPYPQYRHPDVSASEGDIVLSGGILDGASSMEFARQVGKGGRVIGFEPIQGLYEKCVGYTKLYDNITIENLGLWSESAELEFINAGGSSHVTAVSGSGGEICHMISIDEYLHRNHIGCNLIKLDIEGAEPEALEGATAAIRLFKPKLHISLYHNIDHYIQLPLWIMDNFPFYKLYLGHHTPWYGETCLYAVAG